MRNIKNYLHNLDKNAIEKLLEAVGTSDIKRDLMISHYLYETPLNILCGNLGISQQTAYKYHGEIILKITKYLRKNSKET